MVQIELNSADSGAVRSVAAAPQPSIEALLCLIDGQDEASMTALSTWLANVLTVHDPEVRLIIDTNEDYMIIGKTAADGSPTAAGTFVRCSPHAHAYLPTYRHPTVPPRPREEKREIRAEARERT